MSFYKRSSYESGDSDSDLVIDPYNNNCQQEKHEDFPRIQSLQKRFHKATFRSLLQKFVEAPFPIEFYSQYEQEFTIPGLQDYEIDKLNEHSIKVPCDLRNLFEKLNKHACHFAFVLENQYDISHQSALYCAYALASKYN